MLSPGSSSRTQAERFGVQARAVPILEFEMTERKDLKARVRARMARTGESYQAAWRVVTGSHGGEQVDLPTPPASVQRRWGTGIDTSGMPPRELREFNEECARMDVELDRQEKTMAAMLPKLRAIEKDGLDPEIAYEEPSEGEVPFKRMDRPSFWIVQAEAIDLLYWAWETARAKARGKKAPAGPDETSGDYWHAWGLLKGYVSYARGYRTIETKWAHIKLPPQNEQTNLGAWFEDLIRKAGALKEPYLKMCSTCTAYFWGKAALRHACPVCGSENVCTMSETVAKPRRNGMD